MGSHSRFFLDQSGKAVYLTGSHTWNSFQDWGSSNPPPRFEYAKYLDLLTRHGHNFIRLYVWEQASGVAWTNEPVWFSPLPYLRTGPGTALDGLPRFNLKKWNEDYFTRLRSRVQEAGEKGIYVSVMLFDGWSVDGKRDGIPQDVQKRGLGDPWRGHPFHRGNNLNGIDGGEWGQVHTLRNPEAAQLQKAYVRKVIDTVGDLDNVLWEISNESSAEATAWEYDMLRFIHEYESRRPKQHPAGMTAEYPGGNNADLWNSPADWISPGSASDKEYGSDPPPAPGGKVVVTDTDHIWGIGGTNEWVWKSFSRGLNPIFMDPLDADLIGLYPIYRSQTAGPSARETQWESIRENLGYARALANRMNLSEMVPHGELASTNYCLSNPGSEYLVYQPVLPVRHVKLEHVLQQLPSGWFASSVTVDLTAAKGELHYEWFDPQLGRTVASGTVPGNGKRELESPVRRGGVALYIHAQ